MGAKQTAKREQQGVQTKQEIESGKSDEIIPNEKTNVSDMATSENVSTGKRKVLKCIWTFCLQHPKVVIKYACLLFGSIGTLLLGIAAIRPDTSNLSLKGQKDIVKFIETVKSEDSSQFEKILQKIEQVSNASLTNKAVVDACRLQVTGKIEEAIEKWRSIANIFEGYSEDLAADAWFITGYFQSEEGMYEEALSAYSKTLHLKPDYVEAYYKRGAAKLSLGRYKKALTDFRKTFDLKPNHVEAHYGSGGANFSLGRYTEALTDFRKTLDLKPDHIGARDGLKTAKLHLDANKIIDPSSDSTEEYYKRATARLSLSRYKLAINDYNKLIRLDPGHIKAYYERGSAKLSLGQYESAIVDYDEVIRLNPRFPGAYVNRGEAKSGLGQYESAITDCNKAIQLDPNYAYAYYIRADVKFHIREIAGGESDLKTALKIAEKINDEKLKDKIELRFFLKNLHRNHGKRDETLQKNSN